MSRRNTRSTPEGRGGRRRSDRLRRGAAGWRGALCALVLCLAAPFAAAPAAAHPQHGGVVVVILAADHVDDRFGRVAFSLVIANNTGGAATLRGLSAPTAERITIERRRSLFGASFWQSVDFLRIEPGELVRLEPPDYRVLAETSVPAVMTERGVVLFADFGPLGRSPAQDAR